MLTVCKHKAANASHRSCSSRYRFAPIDDRVASNPAQYVRRPQVHATDARGLDRSQLGVFLFTAERYDREHAALAVLLGRNGLRVSQACATNVEDLGLGAVEALDYAGYLAAAVP